MHVEKWPNIILKSCGVNNAKILRYVWPFFNIMHEKVKTCKTNGTIGLKRVKPSMKLLHQVCMEEIP